MEHNEIFQKILNAANAYAEEYDYDFGYEGYEKEEWDEFSDEDKVEIYYNYTDNLEEIIEEAGLEGIDFYYDRDGHRKDMLQLSDNRVLQDITVDIDPETYGEEVVRALEIFDEENNVETETLGRSGRHICIEPSLENLLRYKEIKANYEKAEKEFIDNINSDYSSDNLEESLKMKLEKINKENVINGFEDYMKSIGLSIEEADTRFLGDYISDFAFDIEDEEDLDALNAAEDEIIEKYNIPEYDGFDEMYSDLEESLQPKTEWYDPKKCARCKKEVPEGKGYIILGQTYCDECGPDEEDKLMQQEEDRFNYEQDAENYFGDNYNESLIVKEDTWRNQRFRMEKEGRINGIKTIIHGYLDPISENEFFEKFKKFSDIVNYVYDKYTKCADDIAAKSTIIKTIKDILDKEGYPKDMFNNLDESLIIKEDKNEENKMIITIESGISADGFDITIKNGNNELFKKSYRYGYDASYSREHAESAKRDHDLAIKNNWEYADLYYNLRPYTQDIIEDLMKEYHVSKNNIIVTNGKNVFAEKPVSDRDTNEFINKYIKPINESKEVPYDNTTKKKCPKCGQIYTQYPALSRRDNKTYICPDCGTEEAMEDYLSTMKKERAKKEESLIVKEDREGKVYECMDCGKEFENPFEGMCPYCGSGDIAPFDENDLNESKKFYYDSRINELDKYVDYLLDKYEIPLVGKADTEIGEWIRCWTNIEHQWSNNGNLVGDGTSTGKSYYNELIEASKPFGENLVSTVKSLLNSKNYDKYGHVLYKILEIFKNIINEDIELNESVDLVLEAYGLSLTDMRVEDGMLKVKINGKEYGYQHDELTPEQLKDKFDSIAKHSEGRAYAWLKAHSRLVLGGKKKEESLLKEEAKTVFNKMKESKENKKLDYKLDGFKGVTILVSDRKNGIDIEDYIEFDSMEFGIDKCEFKDSMIDSIKDVLTNLYEFSDIYYEDIYTEEQIDKMAEDITQDVLQLYDDLPEENIDRENSIANLNNVKPALGESKTYTKNRKLKLENNEGNMVEIYHFNNRLNEVRDMIDKAFDQGNAVLMEKYLSLVSTMLNKYNK